MTTETKPCDCLTCRYLVDQQAWKELERHSVKMHGPGHMRLHPRRE